MWAQVKEPRSLPLLPSPVVAGDPSGEAAECRGQHVEN